MSTVEITFARALKIWWSYVWRSCVLMLPVMVVLDIVMFFVIPFPQPGQPPSEQLPEFAVRGLLIWLPGMIAYVLLQAQAMRWMLKTRWSAFRIEVIAEE